MVRKKSQLKSFGNLLGIGGEAKRKIRISTPQRLRPDRVSLEGNESKLVAAQAKPQVEFQPPSSSQDVSSVNLPSPSVSVNPPITPTPPIQTPSGPQMRWTKLGFGLVELTVDSVEPYEWTVPASASFTLIGDSKVVGGSDTKYVLEILPRSRSVEIPESDLVLGGSKYPVPPTSFEFRGRRFRT